MRIKQITAHRIAYSEPNDYDNTRSLILAPVEADTGGVGWGEGITVWPEASLAAATIIEDGLAPVLTGRDTLGTSACWRAMREQVWWYGGAGIASFAVSAVDMALWDLKGKALGQPLRRTRAAIRPAVDFMVDVGYKVRWDVHTAISRIRAFEEHHIRWIEDPLPKDDREGYRQMRLATNTPIATGEREGTPGDYGRLIESGIGDIILADPGRVDGVTGVWDIIRVLGAANRTFNAHSWAGALNTAASVHLTACAPNYIALELKPRPSPPQHDIVVEPIEQRDGFVAVPDKPGLGVDICEHAVKRYEIER